MSGNHLGIFPEGTRIRTGRLGHFYDGAARLSIATNVPIVPVHMDNYNVPLLGVAPVRIGQAIYPESVGGTNGERAKELTDKVKQAIQDMM